MTEYTPEKVAELIAEARAEGADWRENIGAMPLFDRLADALTAVSAERDAEQERRTDLATEYQKAGRSWDTTRERLIDERNEARAERDTAIRDLDAGFAESDHLSAKYYQRMRDAEREMHARELHHFEEEQISADLRAERDSLHKAITEALATAPKLGELRWRNVDRMIGILRAALDKEGNDDE